MMMMMMMMMMMHGSTQPDKAVSNYPFMPWLVLEPPLNRPAAEQPLLNHGDCLLQSFWRCNLCFPAYRNRNP
jgi:hypothetical protein